MDQQGSSTPPPEQKISPEEHQKFLTEVIEQDNPIIRYRVKPDAEIGAVVQDIARQLAAVMLLRKKRGKPYRFEIHVTDRERDPVPLPFATAVNKEIQAKVRVEGERIAAVIRSGTDTVDSRNYLRRQDRDFLRECTTMNGRGGLLTPPMMEWLVRLEKRLEIKPGG